MGLFAALAIGIHTFPEGFIFSGVAGIMVFVSFDELLSTSRAYGKGHDSLVCLVAARLVMAPSLLPMK